MQEFPTIIHREPAAVQYFLGVKPYMATFKIITDSCADLSAQQYAALDVVYTPLSVLLKGKLHDSFATDEDNKMLYNALRDGEMPTTSAANPETWANTMRPILDEGKDILVLAFSSALSTTYQSAVIAAQELIDEYPDRKINVVDSLCAALGQGLLVWYACQKRDEGMTLEQVTDWVEDNKLYICHWVTVDDLFHLKRGGRVSAATAAVGTMLNIKPIIHVNDEGKLINVGKARGRKAAMDILLKKYAELATDNETVFIGHGDCLEDAQILEKALKEKHGVKNIHIGYVGGVIGAHTGPGVLVIFFLGSHR